MAVNKEIKEKVENAINYIRPYLQSDGGDVKLVSISPDLTIKVKLTGACSGCPFSLQTLKLGIEQAIRKEIPQIKEVIAV